MIITHEWTDIPHESETIKKINGEEVSRNILLYGEKPHSPSTDAIVTYDDEGYIQLTSVGTNIPYAAFVRNDSLVIVRDLESLVGETYTVTFEAKSSVGYGDVRLYIGRQQSNYYPVEGELGYDYSLFSLTRVWPEGASWRPHFRFSSDEVGATFGLRNVKVDLTDNVFPYYTGDTPDHSTNPPLVYHNGEWQEYVPTLYI